MAILYPDMNPTCPKHPGLKDHPDELFVHEVDWSRAKLDPETSHVDAPCRHCGAEGSVTIEEDEFSWPEPEETNK